jgi:hypothetical protein
MGNRGSRELTFVSLKAATDPTSTQVHPGWVKQTERMRRRWATSPLRLPREAAPQRAGGAEGFRVRQDLGGLGSLETASLQLELSCA